VEVLRDNIQRLLNPLRLQRLGVKYLFGSRKAAKTQR
jgi:hypothetical protein